jgi:hypothetical protein
MTKFKRSDWTKIVSGEVEASGFILLSFLQNYNCIGYFEIISYINSLDHNKKLDVLDSFLSILIAYPKDIDWIGNCINSLFIKWDPSCFSEHLIVLQKILKDNKGTINEEDCNDNLSDFVDIILKQQKIV